MLHSDAGEFHLLKKETFSNIYIFILVKEMCQIVNGC